MRLRITTPLDIVVDVEDVRSLRAEDISGDFGILPGHADFLTRIGISVVGWHDAAGARHHCAVRGGVLSVTAGREVAIATREAIAGDDLAMLEQIVLSRFRADTEAERAERIESTRLQLAAIRRMIGHLGRGNRGLAA